MSNTVKHQVLSKEKAIEAAVKLARDTLTEHSSRIKKLGEAIEPAIKLATESKRQARSRERKAKWELAKQKMHKAATIASRPGFGKGKQNASCVQHYVVQRHARPRQCA